MCNQSKFLHLSTRIAKPYNGTSVLSGFLPYSYVNFIIISVYHMGSPKSNKITRAILGLKRKGSSELQVIARSLLMLRLFQFIAYHNALP